MFALSIDTNRVVTSFGVVDDGKIVWLMVGVVMNIIQMVITFKYMNEERINAKILQQYNDK